MRKIPFIHEYTIDAMNSDKIMRFSYTGNGRELSQVISNKFPNWEEAYYFVDNNPGEYWIKNKS